MDFGLGNIGSQIFLKRSGLKEHKCKIYRMSCELENKIITAKTKEMFYEC